MLNKYKDRSPEETINIIKKFFDEQDMVIFEKTNKKSESGTWWCNLILFYHGNYIGHSNGKGVTELYSKASGYAELYERFCNGCGGYVGSIAYDKIKENNFNKLNYYLHPQEKIISYKEMITSSPRIFSHFTAMDNKRGGLEQYYKNINKKFIAVPYKNIDENLPPKFLVQEMVIATTGSDGMSAGNTIEEALVQGISEVYEHIIWEEIYKDNNIPIYCVDFNSIDISENLKNIGNNILEKNYDFKIIDFSYTYNFPVVGILLINKNNYNISIILGAHPVFEIALERCFTEIYQGLESLNDFNKCMNASKGIDLNDYQVAHVNSLCIRDIYLEKNFYNQIFVNSYNKKIFLQTDDYDNKFLLNFYIELSKKFNYNFYYYDCSMCKDMKAIHVYLDNVNVFSFFDTKLQSISVVDKTKMLNCITNVYKNFNNYMQTKTGINECVKLLQELKEYYTNPNYYYYLSCLNMYNPSKLFTMKHDSFYQVALKYYSKNITDFINLCRLINQQDEYNHYTLEQKQLINQYKNLYIYSIEKKYTAEEIKDIMQLYQCDFLTEYDYANRENVKYYIEKLLNLFYEIYHSDIFYNYINNFTKIFITTKE